jgi:hypothetical protein
LFFKTKNVLKQSGGIVEPKYEECTGVRIGQNDFWGNPANGL